MVAESKIKTVDEKASTQTRRKVTLKELNCVANQTELDTPKQWINSICVLRY